MWGGNQLTLTVVESYACDGNNLRLEEAWRAYRDIEAVSQDLVQTGAPTIASGCRAAIRHKARLETC